MTIMVLLSDEDISVPQMRFCALQIHLFISFIIYIIIRLITNDEWQIIANFQLRHATSV